MLWDNGCMNRATFAAFLIGILVVFFIAGLIWPNEYAERQKVPLEPIHHYSV